MARFVVVLTVDYDEATIPDNMSMENELIANVNRSVQLDGLLNDPTGEAIVDEWNVKAERK